MTNVYLGIGSNLGDRAAHIDLARERLAAIPQTSLVAVSPIYETEPQGPIPQGRFLNAAAQLETDLEPDALHAALTQIEVEAGRDTPADRQPWGPRQLDLDILMYGDRVISTEDLVIPHPMMHERRFVLEPLVDLKPNLVHPVLQMTVASLLENLKQTTPDPR